MIIKDLIQYLQTLPPDDEIFYRCIEEINGEDHIINYFIEKGYLKHFPPTKRKIVNQYYEE